MNIAILTGYVIKKETYKTTNADKEFVKITLKVNRKFKKDKENEFESDFFECISFIDPINNYISNYINKSDMIVVKGPIRINKYTYIDKMTGEEKKGQKTQIIMDEIELIKRYEEKKEEKEKPLIKNLKKKPVKKIVKETTENLPDDLPF